MVYEMPAALPAEMEGSTYIDERHPLGDSDDRVGEAGEGRERQWKITEQEKEVG